MNHAYVLPQGCQAVKALENDRLLSKYHSNWLVNIGVGVVRDGLRGAIISGRDGAMQQIAYGQGTNAWGHAWGLVSSGFQKPIFRDGAFFYQSVENRFYEAITFGNVISGPMELYTKNFSEQLPHYQWLNAHELYHAHGQSPAMGAAYVPLHALSQGVGSLIETLDFGKGGYFLEQNPFHSYPYHGAP